MNLNYLRVPVIRKFYNMVQLQLLLVFLTSLLFQGSEQDQYSPSNRIINGENAAPKQFPYQVLTEKLVNYDWKRSCGGVIISNRTILTAAHCIRDSMYARKIYFGTVDKTNIYETGQQRLIVKRKNIIVHPEYDSIQFLNDIALIRLPAEILFDEYIQPAKLPDPDKLYDNEIGVVSGWGISDRHSWNLPNNLQYLNVTIFPYEECKPLVHKYKGLHAKFFPASYICLKPSQGRPCKGDSGGPLAIRNEDGTSTLVGLTSFGMDGTCPPNTPVIYTRVSSFLQWIKENE
ncbi:chymotrypsin-2-like isoform X2 [Drosophila sulfurigaster albostrigata]|uniref:chymotrypsin-2-like isoform X2 n=1 Tax=Drosophila sulfurigaster albostrigata TaxID=89887 RepID=UPI002D219376|nr:chymotrypsin-2-like isoform X2 [Drosophila sulfurigaster albostrigata]